MQPDPRTGLFSSSLVKQPSSVETVDSGKCGRVKQTAWEKHADKRLREMEFMYPPPNEVEEAFRHQKWRADRQRVLQAMISSKVPAGRIERFIGCGGQCRVEYSPSTTAYRVKANYCGDRFCMPCCAARAKRTVANLLEWTQGETIRFGTLTLQRDDKSLSIRLEKLVASFRRLREHAVWKKSVRAGIAVFELTLGEAGDHWHVHLHFLCIGTFLDQRELSRAWKKASGGSIIVDIRAVDDHVKAVGYVGKYATKGWAEDVLSHPEALIEAVLSLRGKRLLIPFGEWHGREDELCKAQPQDWKMVGYIRQIYNDAQEEKPYARAILQNLGVAAGRSGGRPTFVGFKVKWSDESG